MRRVLFTALVFLAPCAARAETPLVRTADGRYAATAQLEGGSSGLFVIDTAAACTLASDFSGRNHLAVQTETSSLPDGVPTGRNGFWAPATLIDGNRASLGYFTTQEKYPAGVSGTIGACLLANAVVTFDPARRLLDVHGAAQRGQRLVSSRARLVPAQRLSSGWQPTVLAVPVRLNNAEGLAIVATGVQRSVINRRFAAAAGIDTPTEAGATTLDLAGRARDHFTVAIDDGASLALRGFADQPVMVLGLDALSAWRIVIDYPRDRIWFDPQ